MTETPIHAFKGFDKDLRCRGFQFEVGKTYEHDGPVEVCESGFHACENPLDVWKHYDITNSRFCRVVLSGDTDRDGKDSKIAARRIEIGPELTLPEYIDAATRWVEQNGAVEDGENVIIRFKARAAIIARYANVAISGDNVAAVVTGHGSNVAIAGHNTSIAISGADARLSISSYGVSAAITGSDARVSISGLEAKIAAMGDGAVVTASGPWSHVKGCIGTQVSLASFKWGEIAGFVTGCIGHDGLKPDTWYSAEGGKLVELRPWEEP